MAFRGTESPMDFEWQGHGPMDVNSPFHKAAMANQRKRPHAVFESPNKPSMPALREPNSQPWFFSKPLPPEPLPPQPSPTQFRTPSFTTPRKAVDFDFSSGPESSPAAQADDEETPNGKTELVEFTGGKSTNKRNSLFGLYGRFAPSPGRGEIKKPVSDAMVKRIHKKRRKAQTFEKQMALQRQSSDDTSDDDARPSTSGSRADSNNMANPQKGGWLTGLFTFIHTYPDAPSIIAKYLQVFFNAAILAGCLYMFYSFYATIRADVDRASDEARAGVVAEMAACTKNYIENNCAPDKRLPALETVCDTWEQCMHRDPDQVKRARLSAHTFAEIFNSFVEPISLKTMIFTVTVVLLGLLVNNATFTLYRRSQEHQHMNNDYRHPSNAYMQSSVNMSHFPSTPGVAYGQQHHIGWQQTPHMLDNSQQQRQLEYSQSPSKSTRSRSRSPEKKKLMM